MVVSTDSTTDTTQITDKKNKEDNLTLEFKSSNKTCNEPCNEPSKTHELKKESNIESGLEIQFTSLKLNTFPIVDSNLSSKSESIESISFNNSNIVVGNEILYNVDIKIHNYQKFRMLELKTREFKIAFSVFLTPENTLESDGNGYFRYEIYSKVKNSRLLNIVSLFQRIFTGSPISFGINDLKASVIAENRLQYHKFVMLENSINAYHNIGKKLHLKKCKNLSETQLSFYSLYLLDELSKGKSTIDSWINFNIDNNSNIKVGDFINFVAIHELDIKGVKFDLKETICVKDPISESEIVDGKLRCYRKKIQIKLEKIFK